MTSAGGQPKKMAGKTEAQMNRIAVALQIELPKNAKSKQNSLYEPHTYTLTRAVTHTHTFCCGREGRAWVLILIAKLLI